MKIKFVFKIIFLVIQFSYAQNELDKSNLNSFIETYQLEYINDNNYPEFTSIEDLKIQNKINSRVKNIIIDQTKTDSFNLKLSEHLEKSLNANFSVLNNIDDAKEFFKEKKYKPILTDTEYHLSYYNSILTLLISFHYNAEIKRFRESDIFYNTYYEVYYFDIENGKEYSKNDIFNQNLKSELNNLLEKKIEEKIEFIESSNDQYEYSGFLFPNQYEDFEEYKEIENKEYKIEKISNLPINDYGLVFPKSFSMEYFVPIWNLVTSKLTTKNISLRLTINEIRKFLNPTGPCREVVEGQQNPTATSVFNIKNPPIHFLFNRVTQHDDIFIPYKDTTRSIKKTSVFRQIKDRYKLRENLLYQEVLRLKNGLIDCIKFYDSNGYFGQYIFEYDTNNNLSKISSKNESWNYKYDDNNNLIYSNNNDDEQFEVFYKYYSDYLITETYSNNEFFKLNREITKFSNTNKPIINFTGDLSFAEINYLYDKNDNLLKEIATFSNSDEIWFENNYSYDSENKLLFNTYNKNGKTSYIYDDFGRIKERTISGGSTHNIRIEYNNKNRPTKIETNQKSSGHTYFYSLSYEYW